MEKLLNSYDKEYMKMAMLKHEKTFREQVNELHRLYKVQRILMRNISDENKVQEFRRWNPTSSNSDLQSAYTWHKKDVTKGESMEDDDSELELTLGPTSFYRKKNAMDISDSSASFSSSFSTVCNQMKNTVQENLQSQKWSFKVPSLNLVTKNDSDFEDQLKQHINSPWLIENSNLNSTRKNKPVCVINRA